MLFPILRLRKRRFGFSSHQMFVFQGAIALLVWLASQWSSMSIERAEQSAMNADCFDDTIVYPYVFPNDGVVQLDVWELPNGRIYSPVRSCSIKSRENGEPLTREQWNGITKFRWLEEFWLEQLDAESVKLIDFTKFRHLREVGISESDIPGVQLAALAGLPHLEKASLYSTTRLDEWMPFVGELRHVNYVLLDGPMRDDSLRHLQGLTELKTLHIMSSSITSDALPHITQMQGITRLSLRDCAINEDGVMALSTMTQLEHLCLDHTRGLTDRAMGSLETLTNLRSFTAFNAQVTSAGAESMSKLSQLRYLNLEGTGIGDRGFCMLSKLDSLETLDCSETAIRGVGEPVRFRSLRELRVSGTEFTDDAVSCLTECRSLQRLSMIDTRVTNKCIASLRRMPNLTYVSVDHTAIDEDSEEWQKFLKELEVRQANRSKSGALNPTMP